MRRVTAAIREQPGGAVHASRAAALHPRALVRTLAISIGVGAFLSFSKAFDSGALSFAPRTVLMVGFTLLGSIIGSASYDLVALAPGLRRRPALNSLASGLLMFAPMGLLVWAIDGVAFGGLPPLRQIPIFIYSSLVITAAMTVLYYLLHRRDAPASPAAGPQPSKFLERLPPKLRGAELWAVEAEDHYLRLHTSRGQDLILMRLSDALAELEGAPGAQVHRSWWVAREAIADARRGDGRAVLTLKDGAEVPVSRTHARALRQRGWL